MNIEELDEVLFRFHRAAEAVTPELVACWTRDYPQFADDIRAHAVEIIDMQQAAVDAEVADGAQANGGIISPPSVESLREVVRAAGTTLRNLADDLGIARAIVSDLNSGSIEAGTVRSKFHRLAADRLGLAQDWLASVIAGSAERSANASFKATGLPEAGRRRTWEEAVRDSDMEPARKAFWLSEEP